MSEKNRDGFPRERLALLIRDLESGDRRASNELYELAKLFGARLRPAVPALTKALADLETRDLAAFALAEIGPEARAAVPELIKALSYKPEDYVGTPFALALGAIGPDAREAVPALIEALDVGDSNVNFHVAEALGNIGPAAKGAVTALRTLQAEDSDPEVLKAATEAINKIEHPFFSCQDTMDRSYYGKITPEVYAAALQLRGDDGSCWEERVPLVDPPLVFGPDFPEDVDGDTVIDAWEAAFAESRAEFGEGRFVLESLTVYLMGDDPNDGAFVWEKNVKVIR